jgi:hypothetical protein
MHGRPIRSHEFRQHNVAIAFYIGGIPTFSLDILLVVSYTYEFEVSVPAENFFNHRAAHYGNSPSYLSVGASLQIHYTSQYSHVCIPIHIHGVLNPGKVITPHRSLHIYKCVTCI